MAIPYGMTSGMQNQMYNTTTAGDVSSMKMGSGGGSLIGYGRATTIDPSIMSQLQGLGYILNATSYTAKYVAESFKPTDLEVLPNRTVPAFIDSGGGIYVINTNDNKAFLVTKSPINNDGTTDTGGRNTVVGREPEIVIDTYNPLPTNPVNPVSTTQTGTGGRTASAINLGSGKIYSQFNYDDIIPNQQEIVTRALWSNNVDNLVSYHSSSIQTDEQKKYYIEVYNSASVSDCNSEPQFGIAYGNRYGYGSELDGGAVNNVNDTPSRAIYGQYRLLCLDPNEEAFIIDGVTANSIYVINVNRARMREYIDEGNLEINLSGILAIGNDYTDIDADLSNVVRLVDDSLIAPATIKQSGEVYNIVSGSLEEGINNPDSPTIYGHLYKKKGIIVLDATKLDASLSFATETTRDVNGNNSWRLFTSLSGSAQLVDESGDPLGFKGRSAERVKSTHFFVRAKNADYNFSNNPTFTTGSEGDLRHPDMYRDPKVYITTVGMYNTARDLIAVAKLSQPIQKSFKEEALIKIKLDF